MEINYNELPQLNPLDFATTISFGYFKQPKHLQLIEKYILELLNSDYSKLMINMPPRHGKSEFISKYFPFWYLVRNPDKRVVIASYNQSLASLFGVAMKELFIEFGEKLGVKLSKIKLSAKEFKFDNKRGSFYAVGTGGSLTGRGCDLLIIDDPIKNHQEVESFIKRNFLINWYMTSAITRLEPNGKVIILMTRWHTEDLCGYLLNLEKDNWLTLSLPALALDNDILGREKGEALWAERYDRDFLLNMKNTIFTSWFEGMYQQQPFPEQGEVFNRAKFRYYTEDETYYNLQTNQGFINIEKDECQKFISVDLAISKNPKADYTVGICFAISKDNHYIILDILRDRLSFDEQLNCLYAFYQKHNPIYIGIEKAANSSAVIEQLEKLGVVTNELRHNGKSKMTRASSVIINIAKEKVFFPMYSSWLDDFEQELTAFPHGKHDDQVDALSYITHFELIANTGKITYTGAFASGSPKRRELG